MKKRESVKQRENIIFFPGLEKRLTEKGLECLKQKQYTEAILFLEEARELDSENEDIAIGLILSYFETSSYTKARDLAKEMLLKGLGDYLQMVDLYLTILIHLHEYNEIISTIEALLDEKEIPPEKNEHFQSILQFSRRMAESGPFLQNKDEKVEKIVDQPMNLNLFSIKDLREQMLLISSLSNKNIRPFFNEIQEYLREKSGHPFIKTMLLNLLKEQEIDQKVEIEKFGQMRGIVPIELADIKSQPIVMEVENILKDKVEDKNPILFENIKSLMDRYFFIIYPFSLKPDTPFAWAAAFQFIVLEYYGEEPSPNEFSSEYGVEVSNLLQALAYIREIEEISYPII